MKPTLLLPLLTILHPSDTVLAQGDLDPPGAPAPTMKSLDQLEPRTDIAETETGPTLPGDPLPPATYVIDESGSYYLSSNLDFVTDICIEIRASGVTLDLMGFTISRAPSSGLPDQDVGEGDAITIGEENLSDITIRNGHIRGPGIVDGIANLKTPFPDLAEAVHVTDVSVSDCSGYGILLGTKATNRVERCSVRNVDEDGILAAQVHHSSAADCGGNGISATGGVVSHSLTKNCGEIGIKASEGTISYSSSSPDFEADLGMKCEIAIGCDVSGGAEISHAYDMPQP